MKSLNGWNSTMPKKFLVILVLLLASATHAGAEDDDPNIDLLYPLTLRRPVLETLIDLTASHEKQPGGSRETELAAELEYRALPWWLVSFEVPVVFDHEHKGPTLGGLGDVGLSTRFRLFRSVEHKAQVVGGLAVTLPSGSKSRGLGGETAVEPFLTGGIILEKFHLLADAGYRWTVNSPTSGERQQLAHIGFAAGYELTDRFLPMLELANDRMVRGENGSEGPKLLHKAQIYLTPGINYKFTDETVLRFGVELPTSRTREFDYAVLLGLSIEF